MVVSNYGKLVLSNQNANKSLLESCEHEEADARIFLHVYHASSNGVKKIIIRTVDTDVVAIDEFLKRIS